MRLPAEVPTLYVDFAGDDDLRATVHHHFGAALVYDCYAGSAQKTAFLAESPLPGPKPLLYFAPVQIRKRNADWGPQEVNRRFNEAQGRFIAELSRPGNRWMTLAQSQGFEAAQQVIADLHGAASTRALRTWCGWAEARHAYISSICVLRVCSCAASE